MAPGTGKPPATEITGAAFARKRRRAKGTELRTRQRLFQRRTRNAALWAATKAEGNHGGHGGTERRKTRTVLGNPGGGSARIPQHGPSGGGHRGRQWAFLGSSLSSCLRGSPSSLRPRETRGELGACPASGGVSLSPLCSARGRLPRGDFDGFELSDLGQGHRDSTTAGAAAQSSN
jgi:hypothetical protein